MCPCRSRPDLKRPYAAARSCMPVKEAEALIVTAPFAGTSERFAVVILHVLTVPALL